MFCGQCGKRVLDTMLFCPFCGAPIVIPDQDEAQPAAPAVQPEPVAAPEPQAPEPEVTEPEVEEPEVAEPQPEEFQAASTEAEREAEADAIFDVAPERIPEPQSIPEPEPVPEPELEEEPFEPLFPEREPSPERAPEPERPLSLFDDLPIIDVEENEDEPEDDAPEEEPAPLPPRRPRPARRSPEGRSGNHAYIPVKDVDPDDIFMDSSHPEREDDYDELFGGDGVEDFGEDFDFEEPEPADFLQRHIRGVVGLVLLLMVVVIFFIWAAMPKGQRVLASANLAWRASAYNDLGHDAYDAGQYRQAAEQFQRALARDEDNYEYAHSAMVAYYEAKDVESSLAMLKKCISMDPGNAEPYHELMILYPDAASRPFEVTELLRDGYQRTGDAALNPDGE